jgi:hypothetical protein
MCVFAPTQLINFAFVPPHLRMLALQSVGLCKSSSPSSRLFLIIDQADQEGWNIFLSWSNNINNRQLALAAAALAQAESAELVNPGAVAILEAEVDEREAKQKALHAAGGVNQVGVRMGWA